jgi:hypothetical protein
LRSANRFEHCGADRGSRKMEGEGGGGGEEGDRREERIG